MYSDFNVLSDFLVFRKPARLQLRKNLLAIDVDFKTAAVGRNKNESLDLIFQFGNEFFGQTDRFGLVVSNLAVNDFDFH